ncbi:HPr family phosphocarrier protein [Alkaliphilus peptidifermentans]|uniref:Phosphocarrier protein HPr n=1 Tax=Alkaliphilus peptidifermentans DSM 18978 TaxID=1120976 RepID=A0A1G5HPA2_9FIRM|nr:HPr family phosphocarrier protein [Alkaliphilus peptidifermentans]SCY65534.1 phosphocarrier protein [Alkaliphilus peptidifermentans DSM 18978]
MLEKKVVIQNEIGLHARPASLVVKEATGFKSDIYFVKDGNVFNCKSIMNVLSMGALKGDELILRVEGPDEERALNVMIKLIEKELKEKD